MPRPTGLVFFGFVTDLLKIHGLVASVCGAGVQGICKAILLDPQREDKPAAPVLWTRLVCGGVRVSGWGCAAMCGGSQHTRGIAADPLCLSCILVCVLDCDVQIFSTPIG